MKKLTIIILIFGGLKTLLATEGKAVFEKYCWGCHHQTSEAFGPSFQKIASNRSKDEIRAMISDPQNVSKVFGYNRNAMPNFDLKEDELEAIVNYILSFKPKKIQEDRKE
jgi:cytochrome c551/c552